MGKKKNKRKYSQRTDTGWINPNGVFITFEERKALENAVRTANRRREQLIEKTDDLPAMFGGKPTGGTVGQLRLMGDETDFIVKHKSMSINKFRSRASFEHYMENLNRVNVHVNDYIEDRMKLYKRNHLLAIKRELGDEGRDIYMKIRMMKPKDYMNMIKQNDEVLEIKFVYDPKDKAIRREQIRAALGMKSKE